MDLHVIGVSKQITPVPGVDALLGLAGAAIAAVVPVVVTDPDTVIPPGGRPCNGQRQAGRKLNGSTRCEVEGRAGESRRSWCSADEARKICVSCVLATWLVRVSRPVNNGSTCGRTLLPVSIV